MKKEENPGGGLLRRPVVCLGSRLKDSGRRKFDEERRRFWTRLGKRKTEDGK
ncbi:hypothetical protein [Lewinella sp. W8]|uniref:hypothetical protein n=1 Tax=Lewinella sp. W8 TaxID=2528208 RepID=UPI0012B5958D|nr:hypothetical protein [Lewinella sp. W8]MTB50080.1 hypothetical protein [Lewinella sp. W8]